MGNITYAVIANATDEDGCYGGEVVGTADSVADAVRLLEDAGYRVIPATDGGNVDIYDATDGPAAYGVDTGGLPVIGITVGTGA